MAETSILSIDSVSPVSQGSPYSHRYLAVSKDFGGRRRDHGSRFFIEDESGEDRKSIKSSMKLDGRQQRGQSIRDAWEEQSSIVDRYTCISTRLGGLIILHVDSSGCSP
jgi:hypothetical protein